MCFKLTLTNIRMLWNFINFLENLDSIFGQSKFEK